MIHANLENISRYEILHPSFQMAFDFFKTKDLKNLPIGKVEIDGEKIFAIVSEVEAIKPQESKLESHKKYIDIQIPLSAKETMGWASVGKLKNIAVEYNNQKDIMFFEDVATSYIAVNPGEFVVFFPEDAHQPCIGEGKIKKIIVKVLTSPTP
jgi:YhcH/YjgK/YiaL family protein